MNKGGGSIYSFKELLAIGKACKTHNLRFHLDGARLFNALAETQEIPVDYGKLFDSISICLSKGLGAPVGSVLMGSSEFIKKARRIRKVFGGGMRQAGFLAAAGIYALDNHVERLKHDHRRARQLGEILSGLPFVESIVPIESNLLFFNIDKSFPAAEFLSKLKRNQIHALALSPQTVRFVTHLDFTDDMMTETEKVLRSL